MSKVKCFTLLISAMEQRTTSLESVLIEQEVSTFYSILGKIEEKTEHLLAKQALVKIASGEEAPADQKELIRWYKKSVGDST